MRLSDGRTKAEVANEALRRFAAAKHRRELLDLRGKVWSAATASRRFPIFAR